ncbi:amidohydrolase family protein [Pseudoxanthomonas putridarboris]|uniref:Amidohydrolase family protein n=1 Tax=Pseudoxanthomonas putridarboris TaxID=752605 RepID=A0ABU9IZS7_9GAMM
MLAIVLSACGLAGPAAAESWVVEGAHVLVSPEAVPLADGLVVVRDGRIVAVGTREEVEVPRDARRIDGRGRTLAAGFWNSHVHFLTSDLVKAGTAPAAEVEAGLGALLTRWGFTSVFDIAGPPGNALALRRRIEAGEVRGPRVLTVDAPFYPKDGTPIYVWDLMPPDHDARSDEVATPEEARARAQAQLARGADGSKLFVGAIVGGEVGVLPMDAGIAGAVAGATHAHGKPVFAHPSTTQGVEIAWQAGVDILGHSTPGDGPWSGELASRLVARNMALIPTLKLFEVELRREDAPQEVIDRFLATGQQQLRAFREAGGQVLFGTDVGFIHDADTTREYELMAGAGMDWRAILAALTTAPAQRFGFQDRSGRIAPGMDADLVLLARDPADDVRAFAEVVWVMRGGEVLYSAGETVPAGSL